MPYPDKDNPLVIVTGLPRSGTSMMMQMLEAGGLPVLTDRIRQPDADNPRGYYEYEPVKRTGKDPAWLQDAAGKAVKMVYLLLYDLPPDCAGQVILMRRPLERVIASQQAMLNRTGEQGATVDTATLMKLFEQELQRFEKWLAERPNLTAMEISYPDALKSPSTEAQRIHQFLTVQLNETAMAAAVDTSRL